MCICMQAKIQVKNWNIYKNIIPGIDWQLALYTYTARPSETTHFEKCSYGMREALMHINPADVVTYTQRWQTYTRHNQTCTKNTFGTGGYQWQTSSGHRTVCEVGAMVNINRDSCDSWLTENDVLAARFELSCLSRFPCPTCCCHELRTFQTNTQQSAQ